MQSGVAVLKWEEMKKGSKILLGDYQGRPACGVMADLRLLMRPKVLVSLGLYKLKYSGRKKTFI